MPRFRWQWRGGTNVDSGPSRTHHRDWLDNEIEIIDGRDGSKYAITDDVMKAERIVGALNYAEELRKIT